MARSSKEIKRISRDMLNNRYQIPMGAFVIAGLVPAVLEIPFSMSIGEHPTTTQYVILLIAELLILLINMVLIIGVCHLHLNLTRGRKFSLMDVFVPFRQRTERFFGAVVLFSLPELVFYMPALLTVNWAYRTGFSLYSALIAIGVCLFSLIAIVLFALNYLFAAFLLLDSPDQRVLEAFGDARRMMKGHKLRLLYVLCSFLGWGVLIICSFGIAALWAAPYMCQTLVTFYLDCTGELDHIPVRDYSQMRTTI